MKRVPLGAVNRAPLGEVNKALVSALSRLKTDEVKKDEVVFEAGPMGIEFEPEVVTSEGELGCVVVRVLETAQVDVDVGAAIEAIDGEAVTGWTFSRVVDVLRERSAGSRRVKFRASDDCAKEDAKKATELLSKLRSDLKEDRPHSDAALASTRAALESIRAAKRRRRKGEAVDEDQDDTSVSLQVVKESERLPEDAGRASVVVATAELDLEESRSATKELRAALESSEAGRRRLRLELDARDAELDAARAAVTEARADEARRCDAALDTLREDHGAALRQALAKRDAAHASRVEALRDESRRAARVLAADRDRLEQRIQALDAVVREKNDLIAAERAENRDFLEAVQTRDSARLDDLRGQLEEARSARDSIDADKAAADAALGDLLERFGDDNYLRPNVDRVAALVARQKRRIADADEQLEMPTTTVRLSAGRKSMTPEGQALCFFAGAGSIFAGDKLLTTPNPDAFSDLELFGQLGLKPTAAYAKGEKPTVQADPGVPGEKTRIKWSRPGHTIARNQSKSKKK